MILNWRITLFSCVFGVLFFALGVWQIERGQAKTSLLANAQQRSDLPGEWMTKDMALEVGEPVQLMGRFDPDVVFLLDNRVLAGRVGYEMLQLFHDKSGISALVNRGHVPAPRTRTERPLIPSANKAMQPIRGHAYLTEMQVPAQNVQGDESPWVVQVVIPEQLQDYVDEPIFAYTIRLEENHPDALPRHWPVTTMTPERHYGYALTWFTMAVAVLVIFIVTSKRALREHIE